MLSFLNQFILGFDAPSPWGIYFQDSATPLPKWSGKSLMGIKLPNSGDSLKILILSQARRCLSGWTNYSGIVTSQNMNESEMGYRGSKSIVSENTVVKEQRVYGSWCGINLPHLRCTLMGFERNYQNKILTTQLVNKRGYSTSAVYDEGANNNHDLIIDPHFLTGFTDAEGSFVLSITKSNNVKSGWVIKLRFQIHLHKKDLFVLEAIKNFLGVGNTHVSKAGAVEYRVFSIKGLKVVLDHFDKFPLISQKYGDYLLFKQAYQLLVNREHLTPEGLRKIISIKASINNGLSEPLKEAFPDVTFAIRPIKENISICNPQWLAGFTSGEGSMRAKVRNPDGNSKAFIELIFQINQHIRDKQLIAYIAEYLGCGKVYKHSVNAVVYRVSKRSDLTEIIIPFFIKYPILGIKALDFKDFCSISELIESKAYYNKEGLDQIIHIKANMNTGRI
jgi:hypothetical protein